MRILAKEEIGKILKGLRTDAKLTQKQVAEAIGRKQQVIGHWETGYSQPDANTLFVLCDLYNADINEAFGFVTKSVELNRREQALINAYRNNPDMQAAVDKLLNLDTDTKENVSFYRATYADNETQSLYRAALGGGEHEVIPDGQETLDKLKAAKPDRVTRKEDF